MRVSSEKGGGAGDRTGSTRDERGAMHGGAMALAMASAGGLHAHASGEDFFIGLFILFGFGLAVAIAALPIVALVIASSASSKAKKLEARVHWLETQLHRLALATRPEPAPPAEAPLQAAAPPRIAPHVPQHAPAQGSAPYVPHGGPPQGSAPYVPQGGPPQGSAPSPHMAQAAPPTALPGPPGFAPPVPPETPGTPGTPGTPEARPSIEEQLGLTWLTRIGAAVFLLGALFFFKYAVDNEWIGPLGRVAVGVVAGAATLVFAEATRKTTRPAFVHVLTGIGLSLLIASAWASAVLYDLVPAPFAFGAASVVLVLGAALSLRHRAELLLAFVLLAGFANPVVLSSGEDRPLALFSYLVLLTALGHVVAVRARFLAVHALAVLGVIVLFLGWYGRYFDAHPPSPDLDLPAAQRAGAYFSLAARTVPLVFVGIFGLEWAAIALYLERRNEERDGPTRKALALAALVLMQGGAALLLSDHARLVSGVSIGLGLVSIALLRALDARAWIALPMASAFLALLAVSGGVPEGEKLLLVILLFGWTLVYVGGFLVGPGRRVEVTTRVAAASSATIALFVVLAGIQLLEHHPTTFVLLVGGAAIALSALASAASLPGLALASLLGTAVAVGLAAIFAHYGGGRGEPPRHADFAFLGAAAAWALVPVVAIAQDIARRRAEPSWVHVLTLALAPLAFLAIALTSTSESVPTLRALVTAGAGVVTLVTGAFLLRARPDAHARGSLLAGLSLGLFAAAIAFGLSGATITVLWAALACVAAIIAARSRESLWLGVAALLFAATLVRVVIDADAVAETTNVYMATRGRLGALTVPAFLNPRAYALLATSIALLLGALALGRAARDSAAEPAPGVAIGVASGAAPGPALRRGTDHAALRVASALAAIVGHLLWIVLLVAEVRAATTTMPKAPDVALDVAEWSVFEQSLSSSLAAQAGRLAMTTTLVLAASAALLLTAGFVARSAMHRYFGLVLFSATLLKLAVYDVWKVERVYQILLLTGVGALLVSGGFLYARFGKRLISLMRTGGEPAVSPNKPPPTPPTPPTSPPPTPPPTAAGAAVFLIALLGAGRAHADADEPVARTPEVRVSRYATMRPLTGIDQAGDYATRIDAPLYRESRSETLFADVRIAGPDGRERPYFVRDVSARPTTETAGELFDPGVEASGAVVGTFRLPAGAVHCKVRLDLSGATFLRRVRIETGDTRESLGRVTEGPFVYRIANVTGEGSVEHVDVPYPRSEARIVRVTLLAPTGEREPFLKIAGAVFSCPERGSELPVDTFPLTVVSTTRDEKEKTTTLTLDAGGEGVPFDALLVDVEEREFHRRATVTSTSYQEVWPQSGGGVLYRVAPREGVVLESLRLPLNGVRKRHFRITFHDQDSAPLTVRGVRALVRAREIVMRASSGGEHWLYVGDKEATAPAYDLPAIFQRAERDVEPRPMTLGDLASNPRFGREELEPALPVTERHRGPIGVALAVVLVLLSGWAVWLLRRPAPAGPSEP